MKQYRESNISIIKKIIKEKKANRRLMEAIVKNKNHPLNDIENIKKEYNLIQEKKSNYPKQIRNLVVYIVDNYKEEL